MRKYTCLVAFDIKRAINSVKRTIILLPLVEYDVEPNLPSLIVSFLQERTIYINSGIAAFYSNFFSQETVLSLHARESVRIYG